MGASSSENAGTPSSLDGCEREHPNLEMDDLKVPPF